MVVPTLRLISFLKIHLFTEHNAAKAFSCNSGFFKNDLVFLMLKRSKVVIPNWYLPKYPNVLIAVYFPWDSLKANASLKAVKLFFKNRMSLSLNWIVGLIFVKLFSSFLSITIALYEKRTIPEINKKYLIII